MKNRGIWLVIMSIIVAGILITMSTNFFVKNQKVSELAGTEAAVMAKENRTDVASSEAVDPAKGAAPMAAALEENVPEAPLTEGVAAPQAQSAAAPVQVDAQQEVQEETEMETLAQVQTVRSPLENDETETKALPKQDNAGMMGAKTVVVSGMDYRARLDELGVQIQKIREEGTDSTTYSLKTAADNELKLWDSELNSIYNDLLNHMSDDEDIKLIEEEREWMKARDAAAVEAAKKSAGGTLEGLEYTASLAESTKQRAYELADMYAEITK